VNLVRRRFAEALCIFHFEEKFYGNAGVPVKFIGHPLVGNVQATGTREYFCKKYGLQESGRVVTVLPGSRRGEIAHHLPILIEGLREIRRRIPGPPQIALAVAPGLDAARFEKSFPVDWQVRFVTNDTYNALSAADVAIVSSGTATVETALLNKPMIVVYRLSPMTARLAKPLVKTKFFAMVNLIAGRAVVPELIQDDFTPQRLAAEVESLLSGSPTENPRVLEMLRGLRDVQNLLGPPGAVERAADEIARLLAAKSNAK
jgi:lipid-A-disaccharide synthase